MIPILYESTETQFESQGLGRLTECTRCIVTEERNGIYELEFDYPIDGQLFERLKQGGIVACTHDDTGDIQPFDLYRFSAPLAGIVTFYGQHISYRLGNIAVKPYTATDCIDALSGIQTNSMITNPFTFGTDKRITKTYQTTIPKAARALLGGEEGSILDVFGSGEYEFDKFSVMFHTNRGEDNGVQIRYGKNLSDLTDEVDTTSIYNAVAPYWQGQDATVVLPEGYVSATAPSGITMGTIIRPLDMSGDFAEQPTVAQLRSAAQAYVDRNAQWYAKENISVDFVALWQTPGYEMFAPLERVKLCDTVTVVYEALGIISKQKVVKVVYNVLLDAYDSMELGQLGTTLSAALTGSLASSVQVIQSQIQNIQDTFVISVNGKQGRAVLDAEDVGAVADSVESIAKATYLANTSVFPGSITVSRQGNVIELYAGFNSSAKPTAGSYSGALADGYRPKARYAIFPILSGSSPYNQSGTIWLYDDGTIDFYGVPNSGFIHGTYICQ